MSDVLDHPPFPRLDWTGDGWEGFAPRPAAWQRLRDVSSRHLRGGETSFGVNVTCGTRAPSAAQCAAYRSFLSGGETQVRQVLEAVLAHYRVLRARWLAKHPDLRLPSPERVEDLEQLTQLSTLYVHATEHGGHVHLGIALRAAWDPEHGAGVLLLGDRIVRVGSHDDAMFEPVAARPLAPGPKKSKPVARVKAPSKTPSRTTKKPSKTPSRTTKTPSPVAERAKTTRPKAAGRKKR